MPARTVESVLKRVAQFNGEHGTCWDDPSNLARLNDVIELIHERGDYAGTTAWGIYTVVNGIVTIPIEAESVRGVYACHTNTRLQSEFYEFVDKQTVCSLCLIKNKATPLTLRAEGFRPALFVNPQVPFLLKFINENGEDDGVEISVECRVGDLTERQALALSTDGVSFDGNVNKVLSVSKPITKGDVQAYVDYGAGWVVAGFYPNWIENPSYTQLRAIGCPSTCSQVAAFTKLRHRQLTDYSQLVPIESIQAIKFGYKAMNSMDADDNSGYVGNVQLMENSLEKSDQSLSNSEPSEQICPSYDDLTGP